MQVLEVDLKGFKQGILGSWVPPSKSGEGVWCVGGHVALGRWTPRPVGQGYG